jgi:mono/diheme cytochrome c family protein
MRRVIVAAAALWALMAGCKGKEEAPKVTSLPPEIDAAPPPDAEPPPPPRPAPPLAPVEGASLEAGKKLYAATCAGCHGEDGKGKTERAKTLAMPPTDLTMTSYLCRTTDGRPVPIPSDADVESALDRGTHKGAPELAGLDAVGRRSLLLYVKSLARDFNGDPQPLAHIEPETPDDEASRARGRVMFLAFGCWRCHGVDGKGGGEAVSSIHWNGQKLQKITPLADENAYRCGSDAESVYRVISLGMVGGDGSYAMPRYQEFAERFPRPKEGTPETWTRAIDGKIDAAEVDAVRKFLAEQPDEAAVQGMKPSARRVRAGAMLWDVVHYVRGLP